MLQKAFQRYISNFKGFRREVWILTLVTFINRAGTMVLPFLSKYLKEDLGFSYSQVGWIMVWFGVGSMLGSWLGGKLSDKIGFYKIMIFSLFASGLAFFVLQYITSWGVSKVTNRIEQFFGSRLCDKQKEPIPSPKPHQDLPAVNGEDEKKNDFPYSLR